MFLYIHVEFVTNCTLERFCAWVHIAHSHIYTAVLVSVVSSVHSRRSVPEPATSPDPSPADSVQSLLPRQV